MHVDRLTLGACYYPEHWDESLWADDFRRMRELGLSIIRVGEFAWTVFEPEEGQFSFALFDRALDLAHQHGLQVVFGTPTATPPAWLTHKYPEVLNVSLEGVHYRHGQRRHYNYNAPIYQQLAARMVTRLAEHYADHPAIVGWQIDNEINCEINVFYAQADHAAFRAWLKARYESLERLNQAWGAVFWNQTYTSWEQVHLTRPTVSSSPNPHQALDEKRFISDSARAFVRLQSEILRRLAPRQWITTNGLFGHLDSHQMTDEALDFISYDSYPNFSTIWVDGDDEGLRDRKWSWNLSLTRNISPRFCVMEQQSGPNGWVNRMAAPSPLPGQLRLWTYQSVAHGADAVLYFRWRTATMGTEIYWHGINNYDNRPNRRVREVQRVGHEFEKIGGLIAGTEYQAEVGILRDYDNEWDGELDMWHGPLDRQSSMAWFAALQRRHIPVDLVRLQRQTTADDLGRYRVLVYPHPAILTDETAAILSQYVHRGGQLVLGCRTGYKDQTGQCPMRPMPGPVAGLCGVEVEDFTLIGAHAEPPHIRWSEAAAGVATKAIQFNDILSVTEPGAEVLGRYEGGYYAGAPAVVRNRQGNGATLYYGAAFNAEAVGTIINLYGLTSPADGMLELPPDVELAVRRDTSGPDSYWFLLNFSDREQAVTVQGTLQDVLSGTAISDSVQMAPFDVIVLRMTEKE